MLISQRFGNQKFDKLLKGEVSVTWLPPRYTFDRCATSEKKGKKNKKNTLSRLSFKNCF